MNRHPLIALLIAAILVLSACDSSSSTRAKEEAARKQAAAKAAADKARVESQAAMAEQRLRDLWTYVSVPVPGTIGRQVSASIYSMEPVETDGKEPKRVQLIFRDHPEWGKSSYLVLQGGDFNCYGGCSVKVTADEQAPKTMAARRPPTDEAIAMFINDWRALWTLVAGAKQVSITFPVKVGGTRTAAFEVPGLDRSRMPWDSSPK